MNPIIIFGIMSLIYGLTLYVSISLTVLVRVLHSKPTTISFSFRKAMLFVMAGVIAIYAGNVL